jgi:hypothetical protein
MTTGHLARGGALLLFVACFLRGGAPIVPDARADDTKLAVGSAAVCVLKGTQPVAKGTQLFDAASGGRAIATFTGARLPLQLSAIPADPTAGRGRISTSLGSSSLRIDGFGSPSALPTYSTRDIPVVAGHVWIASGHKVRLVQAGGSTLAAELVVMGSANQSIRASAPCDAFSLDRGTPRPIDVPGNGRLYSSKSATLDLFDTPGGKVVFTLRMTEGTSQLFWSTESKAGFVHVLSRADFVIDAWARASALDAMKKGEMVDQAIPPTTVVAGAQLALDGANPPRLVTASKDIPVRAKRDDKERPIGVVESGAQIYVMETVAGWTNVLPRNLGVTPAGDAGFWVPASEVPKN